jgi:TPR repeat protein
VSKASTWQPSKRDSFTYTLATLGNTKAKYQLSLTLMDEFDENAKAEGQKWLRAAAADGYAEAITRLALIEADPRASRDRESVRKVNCCRPAPRQ